MSGIQILLLIGVAFIALYFLTRFRKRILDIIVLTILIASAVVFILKPELTNRLASRLGVGRGVDLVFYTSILIIWFVLIKLYARIRMLEENYTRTVRDHALSNAVKFRKSSEA